MSRRASLQMLMVLLVAVAAHSDNTGVTTVDGTVPTGVTFAVALKKTIKTSKAKAGDVVKFELLSPVLAGDIVIPAKAIFVGHVVDAGTLQRDLVSRLAILVDRVEWKKNVLPMHGVITSFGHVRWVVQTGNDRCDAAQPNMATQMPSPQRSSEGPGGRLRGDQRIGTPRQTMPSAFEVEQCGQTRASRYTIPSDGEDIAFRRVPPPAQVRFEMVSRKKDIVLHGGTLMVIRNLPTRTRASVAEPAVLQK